MQNITEINLKELIEKETGEIFNRYNKIHSPFNVADKNPSFSIKLNSNTGKWIFKDFSTDAYGDCIDFIMKYKNMNYRQARQYLGLSEEKTDKEIQSDKVTNYIDWQIKNLDNYKDCKLIGLFEFTDMNNNVIYYKAKFLKPDGKKMTPYYHINQDGKVKNSREHDEVIYNLYNTLQAIKNNDVIIITEGEKNANRLNMTLRKGYCATSVKGIRDLSSLDYLKGCKIYVCGDTGEAGEKYKKDIYNAFFKSSKEFKFIRLPGLEKLGENKDIDDWLDLGHTKADLLEAFDKSLDLKNIFELQQDKHGIYKLVKDANGEEEAYKRKYISNFDVIKATILNYIDDELNDIEITFKDEYGKEVKRSGNVIALEDIRSFKCFLNSMNLTFEGKTEDLILLKKWINKYFIDDYCELYSGNQFRKVNNNLLFISPNGAMGIDKVYNDIKSDEKNYNNILNIEPINKDDLKELMQYLFNFSDYKNSYSIIGTVINYLTIHQAISSNIKFSHLLLIGESGSGKSTILEQIVMQLLNYPVELKKSMGMSTNFSFTKDLSIGNYPTIYDEYKPNTFDKYKNKQLSNLFRNAYDRQNAERGNKNQSINLYKLNRPLIMAGEESYPGNEKALIERSCIVYLSRSERTAQNTNAMDWLRKNNYLLNKLGIRLIKKVLGLTVEGYKAIRGEIKDRLINYSFLNDRVLETAISACAGIELLNKVLIDLELPVIKDYEKHIVKNISEEVLLDEKENHSAVEEMLITYNEMIEDGRAYIDDVVLYSPIDDKLYIRTSEMINQLSIYKKSIDNKDLIILSSRDFSKQAQKSGYLIEKGKQKKLNNKNRKMDIYDVEKIRLLNLDNIVESDKLEKSDMTEREQINMGLTPIKAIVSF